MPTFWSEHDSAAFVRSRLQPLRDTLRRSLLKRNLFCDPRRLGYNPRHYGQTKSEEIRQAPISQTQTARPEEYEIAERGCDANRHSARERGSASYARSRTSRPHWPHTQGRGLLAIRPAPFYRSTQYVSAARSMGIARTSHRTYQDSTFPPLERPQRLPPGLPRIHLLATTRIDSN
jgi:hypothetical protein